MGYYTAVLAELVGPAGSVMAFEREPDFAERAACNMRHIANVEVKAQSATGSDIPTCDVTYVNASATHPPSAWLDALSALQGSPILHF